MDGDQGQTYWIIIGVGPVERIAELVERHISIHLRVPGTVWTIKSRNEKYLYIVTYSRGMLPWISLERIS